MIALLLFGLRLRRFDINPNVWAKFISTHNGFHQGSGSSVMDIAEEALSLEASWREHCAKTGMSVLDLGFDVNWHTSVWSSRCCKASSSFTTVQMFMSSQLLLFAG